MNVKINLVIIVVASFMVGIILGKFFLSHDLAKNDEGFQTADLDKYDQGFQAGFAGGYKQGKYDALLPNETNHELHDTCLSIWVGNQIGGEK
jgi:hypothetical protein